MVAPIIPALITATAAMPQLQRQNYRELKRSTKMLTQLRHTIYQELKKQIYYKQYPTIS